MKARYPEHIRGVRNLRKCAELWIKILSFKREAGNIPRNYLEK